MNTPGFARRASVAWLLALLLLSGCASTPAPLPARLTPSGRNSAFSFDPAQPYSAYIEHCRALILAARTDLAGPDRDLALAANLPFELRPDPALFPAAADGRCRKGIILVHGLSDSPYLLQDLGEYFRGRGFLVRAILLPGHGTRPGDLAATSLAEWRRALQYALAATRPEVEQLYLGGFSLGGALAIEQALENPRNLSGLFLFSPCLRIKKAGARWAGLASLFGTWLEIRADRDYAKYESASYNGAAQTVDLTDRIDRLLRRHPQLLASLPVFTALSWEDETADAARSLEFFRRHLTSPASRLLLYSGERTPPGFADPRITLVSSFLPGRKILSLSHLALTVPADDPHYGSQGDYRNCLHYPEAAAEFADCRAGRADWLGERTPANLQAGLLQRLTWNPRYSLQSDELDRFLFALDPPPPTAANGTQGAVAPPAPEGQCICSAGL